MTTLSILAKVNRQFNMASSVLEIHEFRRMVVIGICHERLHTGFNMLARVTCETPESASNLYQKWKRLPPDVRDAWHKLCQ